MTKTTLTDPQPLAVNGRCPPFRTLTHLESFVAKWGGASVTVTSETRTWTVPNRREELPCYGFRPAPKHCTKQVTETTCPVLELVKGRARAVLPLLPGMLPAVKGPRLSPYLRSLKRLRRIEGTEWVLGDGCCLVRMTGDYEKSSVTAETATRNMLALARQAVPVPLAREVVGVKRDGVKWSLLGDHLYPTDLLLGATGVVLFGAGFLAIHRDHDGPWAVVSPLNMTPEEFLVAVGDETGRVPPLHNLLESEE